MATSVARSAVVLMQRRRRLWSALALEQSAGGGGEAWVSRCQGPVWSCLCLLRVPQPPW